MEELINALIFWGATFLILSLGYYFLILKRRFKEYNKKNTTKKKKRKPMDFIEFNYLVTKFNLNLKKVNVLYCFRWIAVIDAFIISLTATVVSYIPLKILWKFMIAFVILFGLIYGLYELLGRHLVKKGWKKNEF